MPSTAHIACLIRNMDGLPNFSRPATAEALYTMTIDSATSRTVARNRTRSDLSFLAKFFRRYFTVALKPSCDRPETLPGIELRLPDRCHERSAVISRSGRRHQLH